MFFRVLVIFLGCFGAWAQQALITINGETTSLEDFQLTQNNNLSQLGIEKSLNLFTEFELISQYAIKEGAEQDPLYRKNYIQSLRELRDEELVDTRQLYPTLEKFYELLKNEYKVQVLYARKDLQKTIEQKLKKGEDFGALIRQYSEDKTYEQPRYVEYYKIDDEYFDVFQSLNIGDISEPISFQDTYVMWIKKVNQRPNLGLVRFQRLVNSDSTLMQLVKKQVEEGGDFTELVKRYSQIPKEENGLVGEVLTGVPDEVYEAVKNLEVGDYTDVFKFNNTFNIYRLLRRVPLQSLEEKKVVLLPIFKGTDQYYELYEKNLQKIDTVSTYQLFPENINELIANAQKWYQDSTQIISHNKPLYTLGNLTVYQSDILKKLKETGVETLNENIVNMTLGDDLYNQKSLYYDNVLFFQEPRLKNKLDSIKKSTLINFAFDQLILKKSYADEEGMQNYINRHPERFTLDERAEMVSYVCVNKTIAEQVYKMVKKNKPQEKILAEFQSKVDANSRPFVILKKGKVSQKSSEYPSQVPFKKGIYLTPELQDRYAVTQIYKILPKQLMTVKEAKLNLLEEYQNEYYKNILENLKQSAEIEIDPTALENLKKQYPW